MKAREVLNRWSGWDSIDVFEISETASSGRLVSFREMTGVDFVNSELSDREIKQFGSYGKDKDGLWRHHVEIATEEGT